MSKNSPSRSFNLVRALEKFALSTFVICSFVAYGLHERFSNSDPVANAVTSNTTTTSPDPQSNSTSNTTQADPAIPTTPPVAQSAPKAAPPPTRVPPTAAPKPQGQYKDGTFTGPAVNTFYGPVQVQAAVQNGKLTKVQFLEYPNDRRTSVSINRQVMPWLQDEAIQAQNANVDIITGATLTSEAFIRSLQVALSNARSGL